MLRFQQFKSRVQPDEQLQRLVTEERFLLATSVPSTGTSLLSSDLRTHHLMELIFGQLYSGWNDLQVASQDERFRGWKDGSAVQLGKHSTN